MDKHGSLLWQGIHEGGKKFYSIDLWQKVQRKQLPCHCRHFLRVKIVLNAKNFVGKRIKKRMKTQNAAVKFSAAVFIHIKGGFFGQHFI
jgi:hypothetical protein